MANENPSVEINLINIGTELTVARAQRLVAIQDICNVFLSARNPEKCFAMLTDNLSAIEILKDQIPQFMTQQYYYYRDALNILDDGIARKKSEITNFSQLRAQKLCRIREKLETCGAEISAIIQSAKESAFEQHYEKFWRRESADLSLISLKIQRLLTRKFPSLIKYASKSEFFFKYCLIKKRHEILSTAEKSLSCVPAEEKMVNDALDTLNDIHQETRRLLLGTFTEPLGDLCDLLHRNYESIYEEFTVIVLHLSLTGMCDLDEAEVIKLKMDRLDNLQLRIETLQNIFDELEDQISNRQKKI